MARSIAEAGATGTESTAGRGAIMQLICLASANSLLSPADLDDIASSSRERFQSDFDEAGFRQIAEVLAWWVK
jgi:hypothetical protein